MVYMAYKLNLNAAADFLLAFAAASAFFIIPQRSSSVNIIQPFNFFVCAASLIVVAEIFISPAHFKRTFRQLKEYFFLLPIGAAFIIIGALWGMQEGFGFGNFTLKEIGRLYFMFWAFLLFGYQATRGGLEKKVYFAFFIPLILSPLLLANDLDRLKNLLPPGFLDDHYKLQAFQGNGSSLAVFLLVPFAFLLAQIFNKKTDWPGKIWGFIGSVVILAFIFWSHSRGGLLAALLVSAVAIALNSSKSAVFFIKSSLVILAIFFLSFTILPTQVKASVFNRFFPNYNYINRDGLPRPILSFQQLGVKSFNIPMFPNLIHSQERQILWPKYIPFLATHPTGFGPEYVNHLPQKLGLKTTAHNSWIQAGLIGGWGLLSALTWLVYKILTAAWRNIRLDRNSITVGFFLAALAILIMAFLNDYLLMKPVWIVASLILARSIRK